MSRASHAQRLPPPAETGYSTMTDDASQNAESEPLPDIEYKWISKIGAEQPQQPSCVAVGMFDGVHRGHRAVLEAARTYANQAGLQLVAVTFDSHPRDLLRPDRRIPLLQTPPARYERLLSAGADAVMALVFTSELAAKTPEQFLDLLCAQVRLRSVFVGDDFRFGAAAEGDCGLLRREGRARGFDVTIIPRMEFAKRPISSTRVRSAIAAGAIEEATAMLGVAHEVKVSALAFHSGHQMAWFHFPVGTAKPPSGRYLGRIRRSPYLPVTVEISAGKEPSKIWHWAEEPLDSLSSLYATPVMLELLDTA